MLTFLSAGLVLGLSAGFSPGPLATLVISQTLRYGIKEGIKVALAPLLTDVPIIFLSLLVLTRLANFKIILGLISLLGGLFILSLAYGSLKIKQLDQPTQGLAAQSISKGILVNALSPHPYLFWLTVGAPLILKAYGQSWVASLLFLITFFGCLVGSKIILAVVSGSSRHLLTDRLYRTIMRALGILLVFFAILLLKEGLVLLGLLTF
jgi:threonine/homoserine/homoserine lactone efflux protein